MEYEPRSVRRGSLPGLPSNLANLIARVEYAVFTKANPVLAWKIFSDTNLWPKFCDAYKSIRWQGTPWTPGSRMRIEIQHPVKVSVDRALTVCMPPHHIAWITHVLGYTMEQWISFDPYQGGSRISTWVELTGVDLSRQISEDVQVYEKILMTWFDNFGRECDRAAEAEESRDIPRAAD